MKFRKISLFLILSLCLSLLPTMAFAGTEAVTLNTVPSIQQGGTVSISGTSTLSEVIITVIRPGNSNVYYNIAKVTNGAFSDSFPLGASEVTGAYKVIVGQGTQVATTTFVVSAAPACTVNCPTPAPPIIGTIGGGTTSASPTPTPTPAGNPVTPPNSLATPVNVDPSKNAASSVTAPNGQVTTTVIQDDTTLATALGAASKQDNHGDAPIVTLVFNNPKGEAVVFSLSAATLALAAVDSPNTLVSFQTNDGEYSLPLNVIDFSTLALSLGTTTGDIRIEVKISNVSTSVSDQIDTIAGNTGTTQLGAAIEFTVTATGNGQTVELNNFGTTYVERNVVLVVPVDETQATVVLYDPITGELSFVPAVFEKQEDGTTKVTFKRNGNSIYTVLSSNKSFGDISKHWAKADIELLASKLVVKGATDTTFAPESNITRAEFAALLVRSLGLTADAASAGFTDVKASDWFAGTVGAAVKANLVSGFEDKSFKPNATITREQMAVMVARAITAAGKKVDATAASSDALAKFSDKAAISSWATVAVAQAVNAQIISGMTTRTFDPTANASRAQAVVMLKRLLQYTDFIN